ncbi:SGNH/GDSL hydrolase family protein [Winogradskyella sp.]|uniref:SGNH/GDSL hydrolase family protein n=1 Tax=Winogradskyella sp. TaxID=1883156 RepID=UPI00260B16A3|nr:SGNH/GDSL hydrolase family protein [Winogradskyella sp.]
MKTIVYQIIFFSLLLCILGCHSQEVGQKDDFDFDNEKEIATLGVFQIDEISESSIVFNPSEGDLTDKVLYDGKTNEFNFNGTYKLIDTKDDKAYYFKFGWQRFDSKTEFIHGNWLTDIPNQSGTYTIKAVKIPFNQRGKIRLCTVGDSQTWWGNGRFLRKLINKQKENFIFVGSNQDVFGYYHEGEGGNHTKDVVNRIDDIPVADIYTLLLGTNDFKENVEKSLENLGIIVQKLKEKNDKAIVYYITPLPTTDKKRDNFNNRLKTMFLEKHQNEIELIDIGTYFRKMDNWKQFFPDGLHLSKKGYDLMANYLATEIKTID